MADSSAVRTGTVLALWLLIGGVCAAPSGEELMRDLVRRNHWHPHVFQQQSLVMIDRHKRRTIRQARQYWRAESDGSAHLLLVFDDPPEIRGTALLASRDADGNSDGGVYLPAFAKRLIRGGDEPQGSGVLGTDLNIFDLAPEDLASHRYQRQADTRIDDIAYLVVDAIPVDDQSATRLGYARCRHFIRSGRFVVERSDCFDPQDRLIKRRTWHDWVFIPASGWQANMLLVEDLREQHKSLIKVVERVYSADYVPEHLFQAETLFANAHMEQPGTLPSRAADN